jgi:adenylyl-sulfate kinase
MNAKTAYFVHLCNFTQKHRSMSNLFPAQGSVSKEERAVLLHQRPLVIWFTGLSGAGKSTLAHGITRKLHDSRIHTFHLDGDNLRSGLNNNLGFSEEDRTENIRRAAEVASLMADAGLVVLSSFISPFQKDRELVRKIIGSERLVEVFVDCPLEVCEQRDVKGLYKRARSGELKNFTGIDSPYEVPSHPDIHVRTDQQSEIDLIDQISKQIIARVN